MSETSSQAGVQRNIRAATLIWVGAILLSRILGFARDIIIARQAGANASTDVYFTAFTIPDFLNYLLAGGALSITFIPIFSKYLAEDREAEGWKVFSIVTTFLAVTLGVGIGLGMLLTPWLTPLIARGFNPEQQAELVRLTRILLPAQFFVFQGFLLSAVQMAKGKHSLPALAPLLYNGGTILGGVLLGPTLGMEGFAWGVLIGAFTGNFALQVYGARQLGMVWTPRLELRHEGFISYFKLSLPIMVGQSLVAWDDWLIRYFGSFLGAASISWLNYGKKLASVPLAVFGQATGYASYPHMARQVAEGKFTEMYETLSRALRSVLVLALCTQVFLVVLAPDICYVLFRSSRFLDADVAATAQVLALFSLGIVAWAVQGMVARGFYALNDTLTPTGLGTLLTLLCFPLYMLLSRELGHLGLALGSSLSISIYAWILSWAFRRKLQQKSETPLGYPLTPFLLRVLLACAAGTAVAYGTRQGLLQVTGTGSWLAGLLSSLVSSILGKSSDAAVLWLLALFRGLLVGAISAPVLIGACLFLGIEEILDIVLKVTRKLLGIRRAELLLGRFRSRTALKA